MYQQSDATLSTSSFAGNLDWSDYTLTLKARRTSPGGAIVINVCDDNSPAKASRVQWILGGTVGGPTVADPSKPEFVLQTHFAEQDQLLAHTPGTLETNRWYDIKMSIRGRHLEVWLDGKLVQSADLAPRRIPALFTSATRDEKTGDIILKVVNPGDFPMRTTVNLRGVSYIAANGKATVLSGNLVAEDTLQDPMHVVPETTNFTGIGTEFTHNFGPHSITVVRLATK